MMTFNRWVTMSSGFLGFALTGCNITDLTALKSQASAAPAPYVSVSAQVCTSAPAPAKQKIKYVFILDHSQSNQPGFPAPGVTSDVSSTDPQGWVRYAPIIQFLNNLTPDPNVTTAFSLIDFNNGAYQPGSGRWGCGPNSVSGFDFSLDNFTNTVYGDWQGSGTPSSQLPNDQGFTNYQAAIQCVSALIASDAQHEASNPIKPIVSSLYQIIFVSDGVPTVNPNNGGGAVYTQQFSADIQPLITSIIDLKSDQTFGPYISGISFNTAYYYRSTAIPEAEALLQKMAISGNGQYLQFGNGLGIVYQAFAPPSRNIKYLLSDIFLENASIVWWNNKPLLDSDTDGLPDSIESSLGSNPLKTDSDGNGVSDLVEYRTKGKPCNDAKCNPAARDPYSICSGIASQTQPTDGSVLFASSSNDGLNDCEKFILRGSSDDFDSNGDFIPDLLAFKNNIAFIPNTNTSLSDPFSDGLTNYQKLKMGLPVNVSNSKLPATEPRTFSLKHLDNSTNDIECYQQNFDNVLISGDNNKIRIFVVQNASLIDNKPVLKIAERTLDGQVSPVVFGPGDFQ